MAKSSGNWPAQDYCEMERYGFRVSKIARRWARQKRRNRVEIAGQSAIDAGSFDLTIILRWPITAQFCYFMRKMVKTQKLVASLLSDLGFQLNMYCVTKSRERKKWRMILYSCENDRRPVGRGLTVVYHFLRPRLFVTRYTFEHV